MITHKKLFQLLLNAVRIREIIHFRIGRKFLCIWYFYAAQYRVYFMVKMFLMKTLITVSVEDVGLIGRFGTYWMIINGFFEVNSLLKMWNNWLGFVLDSLSEITRKAKWKHRRFIRIFRNFFNPLLLKVPSQTASSIKHTGFKAEMVT